MLNAMSDAEVNYHIAPSLRSMLTRAEKIEEHMTHIARENGAIISCDPNLRLPLWPSADAARDMLRLAITKADIVIISDDEVAFITGKDDLLVGVCDFWCDHSTLMIVTPGPNGSRAFTLDFSRSPERF